MLLGLPRSTVGNILMLYRRTGSILGRHNIGLLEKVNPQILDFLLEQKKLNTSYRKMSQLVTD